MRRAIAREDGEGSKDSFRPGEIFLRNAAVKAS